MSICCCECQQNLPATAFSKRQIVKRQIVLRGSAGSARCRECIADAPRRYARAEDGQAVRGGDIVYVERRCPAFLPIALANWLWRRVAAGDPDAISARCPDRLDAIAEAQAVRAEAQVRAAAYAIEAAIRQPIDEAHDELMDDGADMAQREALEAHYRHRFESRLRHGYRVRLATAKKPLQGGRLYKLQLSAGESFLPGVLDVLDDYLRSKHTKHDFGPPRYDGDELEGGVLTLDEAVDYLVDTIIDVYVQAALDAWIPLEAERRALERLHKKQAE